MLFVLLQALCGAALAKKLSWAAEHPSPKDYSSIPDLVSVPIKDGVNLITNGTVLFDCVKNDCGASVLVCTSTADHCYLRCDKYSSCGGVEFYSAARGTTEINCDGTTACMGSFFNCGPIHHRGADGFRKYPGYDKENVKGIRDNRLFERRSYGRCSVWCGKVGCKEAHLECNGYWREGCHFYAGKETDAFMEGHLGARLAKWNKRRPNANVMKLYCDGALSCGDSVHFACQKGSNCKCEGKCKGLKVQGFEAVDIPPTAKCNPKNKKKNKKSNAVAIMEPFVNCRQNFECNAYCEEIHCLKSCDSIDCNGDDACAGTKSRKLKLRKVVGVGDPVLGMALKCNGDRTCKDLGGITSTGWGRPKSERGFHLTHLDRVVCSGDNSCEGSYFNAKCVKEGCYWECGDNACLYSEIEVDWLRRLTCAAQNTCAFLNLTAGIKADHFGWSCGEDGCHGGIFKLHVHPTVKHLGAIACNGRASCKDFTVHIESNHPVTVEEVVCAQAESCHGARFSGSPGVKWPEVQCGGRRGPCKDFKINGKEVLKPLPTTTKKVAVRRRLVDRLGEEENVLMN